MILAKPNPSNLSGDVLRPLELVIPPTRKMGKSLIGETWADGDTVRSDLRKEGMAQLPKTDILVVDDYEPWRSKAREILQARPEWRIVGEACDGPEAVEMATKLEPDIILLDLGLPTLNGIEVARIIRQRCPESGIIFLTQNVDEEIMAEALSIRRARFVLKINSSTELLDAISAALHDS